MRSPRVSGALVLVLASLSGTGIACGRAQRAATTTITSAEIAAGREGTANRAFVPVNARHEITFDATPGVSDPDDVTVAATFTAPSGKLVEVGGFPSRGHYKVRYTPREVGIHRWSIRSTGGELARGELEAVSSRRRGFVHVDPEHRRRLVADDGSTVLVLGENRVTVYDPTWNYGRADIRSYVERMASYGMTTIRVVLSADCPRLGCLERGPGRFDERTAEAFDTLFDAAEAANVDVILVAFALGSRSWNDNPYSVARGGRARSPKDFFLDPAVRADAIRKLRYIADRWGSSPRLLAVDLLDEPERDGAVREQVWIPWAEALSRGWRSADPYGHLVTAGPIGLHWNVEDDELPWYASTANDLVQWHLFGKEVYAPHALADAMARKVGETAALDKPVLCGVFGYGGEDDSSFDHTHVGLWSLALSGAGALSNSAPPFDVDSYGSMPPARAQHFRVLSTFMRSLDARRAYAPRDDVRIVAPRGARVWSIATDDESDRAIWLLGPEDGYAERVLGGTLAIAAPRGGRYHVVWIDDTTGAALGGPQLLTATDDDVLLLSIPPFRRHIAARITHE